MPGGAHNRHLSPTVDDRTVFSWFLPWTILLVPGLTLDSQPLVLRYASKTAPSPCSVLLGIRSTTALDHHQQANGIPDLECKPTYHQDLVLWVQYHKDDDKQIRRNSAPKWPTCHCHPPGHQDFNGPVYNNRARNSIGSSVVTVTNDRRHCELFLGTVDWICHSEYLEYLPLSVHSPQVTMTKDNLGPNPRTLVRLASTEGRGEGGASTRPPLAPLHVSVRPLVISSCIKCIQFVMIWNNVVLRVNDSGVVMYPIVAATCLSFHFHRFFSLLSNLGEIRIGLSIDFYNLYKGINVYFMFIHIKQE